MNNTIELKKVVKFLNDYCGSEKIVDFVGAQNGLQFENSGKVTHIATAVDAGLAEIKFAAALGADLLIVHHGMFWNPPVPFVRHNYQKVKTLIDSDIAVYSTHLPLDAHDELGNNVLIAKTLGLKIVGKCFCYEGTDIGVIAEVPKSNRDELEKRLKELFPKTYKEIKFGSQKPKKVAICSGSCAAVLPEMSKYDVDTLICGELKQANFATAQELELNLYPCGHYATECFGIMALGEITAKKFGIDCNFIEMANPL